MAGLTAEGFVPYSLEEIVAMLKTNLESVLGVKLASDPDSVSGQILGREALPLLEHQEQLALVYASQFRKTAFGVSLDRACSYNDIFRLPPQKSLCYVTLKTSSAADVSLTKAFKLKMVDSDVFFDLKEDTVISSSSLGFVSVSVSAPALGTVYTVLIDSQTFTYTASAADTNESVASNLALVINSFSDSNFIEVLASADVDKLSILSVDGASNFSFGVGSSLTILKLGINALFEAEVPGPQRVPVGMLSIIDTPLSQIESAYNLGEAIVGSITESDIQLRERCDESLAIGGSSTLAAVRSKILQYCANVTSCFIVDNDSDYVVDGLPPHSFNVVVKGGVASEIAQVIWDNKPLGIQSFGSKQATAYDEEGLPRIVSFSPVSSIYVFVKVKVTNDSSGLFPANGFLAIAENIASFMEKAAIGDDVIVQKLFSPVMAIAGVAYAEISVGVSVSAEAPSSSVSFGFQNIVLPVSQQPVYLSRNVFCEFA